MIYSSVMMEVNLQLVCSEAGPRSLGGFRMVNLLLGGHSPLHVHAVSCRKKHTIMRHFKIFNTQLEISKKQPQFPLISNQFTGLLENLCTFS